MRKMICDILDKKAPEGLEAEIVQQGAREAQLIGVSPKGFMLPAFIAGRAAVNTTSTSDTPKTGYYIQTDTLVDARVEVLRNAFEEFRAYAKENKKCIAV